MAARCSPSLEYLWLYPCVHTICVQLPIFKHMYERQTVVYTHAYPQWACNSLHPARLCISMADSQIGPCGWWQKCRRNAKYYVRLSVYSHVVQSTGQNGVTWQKTVILIVGTVKGAIHSKLNWVILLCDVIRDGKLSKLRSFDRQIAPASELSFPVIFHTENCAVHSGNPTVSSFYLPTPNRLYNLQHPLLTIHSADEHRMIYSFSNTTSYSTFYAFFSSFRIALWPMWLANSKQQYCVYPPQSHAQEDTQNWQTWWETRAVPENINFSSCSFFFLTAQFNLECALYTLMYSHNDTYSVFIVQRCRCPAKALNLSIPARLYKHVRSVIIWKHQSSLRHCTATYTLL